MNKMIKKLALALTVCTALCATTMAAPKPGSPNGGGKAPSAMKSSAPKREAARPKAQKAEPRREVAHNNRHQTHAPAPAKHHTPAPPPPKPQKPHHHHNNSTLHTEDWCSIGASLVGGLIGGLVGSAM